jgi:hypothetical protein
MTSQSVTFTPFSDNTYATEQGTPFIINTLEVSDPTTIDPTVLSQLAPPPPPNTTEGTFNDLNYYSTGYVFLNSMRSRVTNLAHKGKDDTASGNRREIKFKVFNKGYTEIDDNVYFQVSKTEMDQMSYFRINDASGDLIVDVYGTAPETGTDNIRFNVPRMTDLTTEYTIHYKTLTNVVASLQSFKAVGDITEYSIDENSAEDTELFTFEATTIHDEIVDGSYEITSGNSSNYFKIEGSKLLTSGTPISFEDLGASGSATVEISLEVSCTVETTSVTKSNLYKVIVNNLDEVPTGVTFTPDSTVTLKTDLTNIKIGVVKATDEDVKTDFNTYEYEVYMSETTTPHSLLEIKNINELWIKEGENLAAGQNGFTITATSVNDASHIITNSNLYVSVSQHDRAPTVKDTSDHEVTVAEDSGPHTIELSQFFEDLDGDTMTYDFHESITGSIISGEIVGSTLNYSLTANAYGNTMFSVKATANGKSSENAKKFNITVTSVNDTPSYKDTLSNVTVVSGTPVSSIDLSQHFEDVDGDTLSYTSTSSDTNVATVSISGTTLTIEEVGSSSSTRQCNIEITASDGSLTVVHTMPVTFSGADRKIGDVNNDNIVDIQDLLFLQKYLNRLTTQVNLANADSDFSTAANLNADGYVDVADLIHLYYRLEGVSGY